MVADMPCVVLCVARGAWVQRMAHIEEAAQQFKKHQDSIIKSLKDKDVSLRRRALDVLYSMCDSHNSELVVGQLLEYLEVAPPCTTCRSCCWPPARPLPPPTRGAPPGAVCAAVLTRGGRGRTQERR